MRGGVAYRGLVGLGRGRERPVGSGLYGAWRRSGWWQWGTETAGTEREWRRRGAGCGAAGARSVEGGAGDGLKTSGGRADA